MIRHSTIAILGALVLAVAAVSWWTVRAMRRPKSVIELKLAEAERVLYYRMTRENGPKIRLSGAERTLRIITHVMLPPGLEYDPTRRIRYGIKLEITSGNTSLWKHEIYTQSRQSKEGEQEDGVFLKENSFVRDGSIQVSDDRMFIIHLDPDRIPANALLHTTLIGREAKEGLIRFYNQTERGQLERIVRARALPRSKQQDNVRTNTYEPWAMVEPDEKYMRVRFRTERLSAVGKRGVDYETQVVYYTGFRLPLELLEVEEMIKVHRHRYGALNIVGPTTLELDVCLEVHGEPTEPTSHGGAGAARSSHERAEPCLGDPVKAGQGEIHSWRPPTVELGSVSADPLGPKPHAEFQAGVRAAKVTIPPGLHSIRLTTATDYRFEVQIHGQKKTSFGAPADVGDDEGELRPDEIRIPVLMSGPGKLPVRVAALGAPDPLSRLLRVEVRFIDTTTPAVHEPHERGDAAELFAGRLTARFFDNDGQEIRTAEQELRSERAPFEWLDQTGKPAFELSEPVDVRLVAPEGISQLELATSKPAVIRLYRYIRGENLYELPYREAELDDDIKWRYARIEKRVWWPMRAVNHEEVEKAEQLATLVCQARLEKRYTGDGKDETETPREVSSVVIEPLDDPERHMIMEPLPPEKLDEAREKWGPGLVARLPTGRAEDYRWDAAAHKRARIHYWLDKEDLGKEVEIAVDGESVLTSRFYTTQGFWELPPLPPGTHRVEITKAAPSLRTVIDRAPLSAALGLERMRTVFAMNRVPLRLRVRKHGGRRSVIYAVLYAPVKDARPDIQIRSIVSGGHPKRVEGTMLPTVTLADKQVPLPAAKWPHQATFVDQQTGAVGYPRIVAIPLGEDIIAGTHFIEIYSVTDYRLWNRFYITNYELAAPEERVLQWNFREPQ